ALEAVGASEAVLTAPASGFFLRATDGWEGLSPADAGTLTVEAIETVLRRGAEPTSAPGKLVTGSLWLFAAPVGAGEAARFSPGETVALTLCGERVEAEVRRIIRGGAGGAVVFACRTGLDAVLSVREAAAEALLSETEGLALPAEAIREDGGGTFVFRVAGPYARRETVTVLSVRDGEALVVSDALREGSLVLLGGEYADGMLIGR
ncbi:MAG: hypothetical protein IKQ10_01860, partial [Oscillospiraceae bacterium]|nr:hypothetical protein [Oscillospiraceae bacterium]